MTRVGLSVLNTADWTLDHSLLVQMQGIGERYAGACPVYVVEHPMGRCSTTPASVTRCGPTPRELRSVRRAAMVDLVSTLEVDESQHLPTLLEADGFSVDEIDTAVQSHLHADHAGNLDQFVGTEVFVHHDQADQERLRELV